MLPQDLLGLVKTLIARIDNHGNALSEWQTRYVLIDPLLRELGWDTGNPDQVIVEYSLGKKRADYALLKSGRPEIIVEAKPPSTPLKDGLTQAFDYTTKKMEARYFSVTNGVICEVYDTSKPPVDMKIVSFDLKNQSPAVVCLHALALWRPSVESNHVIAAQAPVVGMDHSPTGTKESETSNETNDPPEYDWQPLTEVGSQTPASFPVEVQFPDGSRAPLKEGYTLVEEVVKWLTDKGMLNEPVPSQKSGKRIVNNESVHPDGSPIPWPHQVNKWFISRHGNWRQHIIPRTKRIIEHVDQDPTHFAVRFS